MPILTQCIIILATNDTKDSSVASLITDFHFFFLATDFHRFAGFYPVYCLLFTPLSPIAYRPLLIVLLFPPTARRPSLVRLACRADV